MSRLAIMNVVYFQKRPSAGSKFGQSAESIREIS